VEEDIHRGALVANQRTRLDLNVIPGPTPFDQHMVISRGNQREAGQEGVAIAGLTHFNLAQAIEAVGKRGSETWRHVLHNDNPGAVGGKLGQNGFQGFCASGRGTNGNDLMRGLAQRLVQQPHPGHLTAGWGLFRFLRRAQPHLGCGTNLFHQLHTHVANRIRSSGLGKHLHRTVLHCLQCHFAVLLRQGTDNDGRQGVILHQLSQETQPVHTWHLDIQREYIGLEFYNFVPGHIGVGGGANYHDIRMLGKLLGEDLADNRRVVDHQNFDWFHLFLWFLVPRGNHTRLARALS